MNKSLTCVLLFSIAVSGCGSRLAWQGPPGSTQEDVSNATASCRQQADQWVAQNEQSYDDLNMMNEQEIPLSRTGALYGYANELFDQCMVAKGYELQPRPE